MKNHPRTTLAILLNTGLLLAAIACKAPSSALIEQPIHVVESTTATATAERTAPQPAEGLPKAVHPIVTHSPRVRHEALPINTAQDAAYEDVVVRLTKLGLRSAANGGNSSQLGDFVVAMVRIDQNPNMDTCALNARRKIAEYLGVQVSGQTTVKKATTTQGVGANRKTTFSSSFQKVTSTRVNQLLAGVGMHELRENGGHTYAIYVLSEVDAKRAGKLAQKVRETREFAIGYGIVPLTEDRAADRAHALALAQREAVSKISGMVIVADSLVRNNKELHETLMGRTSGLIAGWEVVDGIDGVQGYYYAIKILCDVDAGGVYAEYSAFLRAMGDPGFHVRSDNPALRQRFEKLLDEWGFRLTANEDAADYWLNLDPQYEDLIHPLNNAKGTRITLGVELLDTKSGAVYSPVRSDGRQTCFLPGLPRQKEKCAALAAEALADELKAELAEVVRRFSSDGRPITVSFEDGAKVEAIHQDVWRDTIRKIPGVRSCSRKLEESTLIFEVTYTGKSEVLDSLIRGDLDLLDDPALQSMHLRVLEYAAITYTLN